MMDTDFVRKIRDSIDTAHPDWMVETRRHNVLFINGYNLNLADLYRSIQLDPAKEQALIDAQIARMEEVSAENILDRDFSVLRPYIMPRLYMENAACSFPFAKTVRAPFTQDVSITFVIDTPGNTISITTEQMNDWGSNAEEIEDIAQGNLRQTVCHIPLETVSKHCLVLTKNDGYDAARLLAGDLQGKLRRRFGGDFLVGIPSRDVLVAFSPISHKFTARQSAWMQSEFERLPYPITPQLFLVTRDGVADYLQR